MANNTNKNANKNKPPIPPEELTPEELATLKADSELADAKLKQAKKSKAEKAKTYTESEMQDIIRETVLKMRQEENKANDDSLDETDPYAQKTLTLGRFPNKAGEWKFILGFADTNTDPYSKEPKFSFDIWNEMVKKNEAYVKVVFDGMIKDADGKEIEDTMTLPLQTVIKKSRSYPVDIIDTKKVDKSYSAGKTEKVVVGPTDWSPKSEGQIKMKVSQFDYSFLVKLPDGREVNVSKHVVNWKPAPKI